jgi:hypothetical protein
MFHHEILRPRLICLFVLAVVALAPAPCVAQDEGESAAPAAVEGDGEEEETTVAQGNEGTTPRGDEAPIDGAFAEQQPQTTGPLGAPDPQPQSTGVPGGTATAPETSSASPPADPAPVNAGFEPKSDAKPEGSFQLASAENTRSMGAPVAPAVPAVGAAGAAPVAPAAPAAPAAQNPAPVQNPAPTRQSLADAVRENGGWGPQVRESLAGHTDQQLQNRLNSLRNSPTGDQLTNGQMRGALEREIFERSRR